MNNFKIFALAFTLSALAPACSDSSVGDGDSASISTPENGSADRPCDGGAFPDDPEYREFVCAVQWAQLDVMSAGGEIDPTWGSRSSEAILLYGEDRAAAIAELEAVFAEMITATP